MNRIVGRKLVRDSMAYPGHGFMNNLFFIRDSSMYIGGGFDSGAGHYTYQDFWRYDMCSHEWARLQDLPFYYHHPLSVFAEDGRIVVLVARLGGEKLQHAVPVFYEYFPENDTWKTISRELPVTQLAHTSIDKASLGLYPVSFRIRDEVFVFFQIWETGVNSFYKFSLKDAEWTELPPFPGTTKDLISAFAVSDGVYGYIGGGWGRKRVDNSKEVFRYDPELQKWEQIKDLPLGVRYAKGWRYKGESYVGFGINDKDLTVIVWKLRQKK
jgi:N-acetylneuraminic acid mutarotase